MRYTEMHPGKRMVRGQRVHCILHGGKDGVVTAIHGEQHPDTCDTLCRGVIVVGGNADLDIVWDDGTESRRVPESLARTSVQWKLFEEVAPETEIAAMETRLATEKARRAAEAEAKAEAFRKEKEQLATEYDYLLLEGAESCAFTRAIKNLRILLKRNFPTVKFSVRQERYGSLSVTWTDGPLRNQVARIAERFEAGSPDGMTESYKYTTTPWNSLFGETKYLSCDRKESVAVVEKSIDMLWQVMPGNLFGVEKPAADRLDYGPSPQVPHLGDKTVRGLVNCLSSCFDGTAGRFVVPDWYMGDKSVVERAVAMQDAQGSEARP